MGQKFGIDVITSFTFTSSSVTLGAGSRVTVSGQQKLVSSPLILSTATTGLGGLDTGVIQANRLYQVWLARSGNNYGLVATLSALPTLPSGFTIAGYIGRMITDGSSNVVGAHHKDQKHVLAVVRNTLTGIAQGGWGATGTSSALSPIVLTPGIWRVRSWYNLHQSVGTTQVERAYMQLSPPAGVTLLDQNTYIHDFWPKNAPNVHVTEGEYTIKISGVNNASISPTVTVSHTGGAPLFTTAQYAEKLADLEDSNL